MPIGSWISELLVITAAGAAGWLVGLASAWLTDCVMRLDGGPCRLPRASWCSILWCKVRVAATWMILATRRTQLAGGAAALVAVPLVQAAVTDWRYGYVFTVVVGWGVAMSVALAPIAHLAAPWAGVSGAAVGLVEYVASANARTCGVRRCHHGTRRCADRSHGRSGGRARSVCGTGGGPGTERVARALRSSCEAFNGGKHAVRTRALRGRADFACTALKCGSEGSVLFGSSRCSPGKARGYRHGVVHSLEGVHHAD